MPLNKDDTSDVVEIWKVSNISVKEDFGAASNQNTDKFSCFPDSVNIT